MAKHDADDDGNDGDVEDKAITKMTTVMTTTTPIIRRRRSWRKRWWWWWWWRRRRRWWWWWWRWCESCYNIPSPPSWIICPGPIVPASGSFPRSFPTASLFARPDLLLARTNRRGGEITRFSQTLVHCSYGRWSSKLVLTHGLPRPPLVEYSDFTASVEKFLQDEPLRSGYIFRFNCRLTLRREGGCHGGEILDQEPGKFPR